jgi:ArsR family transcriptional regulator, arsenate/arsenite/antimonite-responsive transcriptional repressor
MRTLSRRFKALSEEHRLRIIAHLLEHGEVCVCEVEHFLGISQSAASRHLRYLAGERLVEGRRDGQWVFYRLTEPADETHRLLLEALRELLATADTPGDAAVEAFRNQRCIGVAVKPGPGRSSAAEVAR